MGNYEKVEPISEKASVGAEQKPSANHYCVCVNLKLYMN